MSVVTRDSVSHVSADVSPPCQVPSLSGTAAEHEVRNFAALALYQIGMRIGWVFKTESIIMPAVLDSITGGGAIGGFLRGCLPILNRIGHSVPPILFSRRLKVLPKKSQALLVCTLVMAVLFGLLAMIWQLQGTPYEAWMPWLYIGCYLTFFAATGINNLTYGTLQGKLVRTTRRGRLLLIANVVGGAMAIVSAAWLLPGWLTASGGRFDYVFGVASLCFLLSAVMVLFLREPRDCYQEPDRGVGHLFVSAWRVFLEDQNFRRLAAVAIGFGSSLALFPHYQALGRSERLGLSFENLVGWVILQNLGMALFSLVAGPIADRRGNRLVMRSVMFGIAAMPITAVALSYWSRWGATLYPIVFLFIGLTPVGFKAFNNYTLEISSPDQHPRYLSTLGLCYAVPLLFSPILGWVVSVIGFDRVFIVVSLVVFAGGLLTFRLHEPRLVSRSL